MPSGAAAAAAGGGTDSHMLAVPTHILLKT